MITHHVLRVIGDRFALKTQVEEQLAGIIALSCYLPAPKTVKVTEAAKKAPILQCHGEMDDVVRIKFAHRTKEFLEKAGIKDNVFLTYEDGHSCSFDELNDIFGWLEMHLGAKST